jgi:hypothetical protein
MRAYWSAASAMKKLTSWSTIQRNWPSTAVELHFEPCLSEPEPLFPGNRIMCAGTKARKHPPEVQRDSGRNEAHINKSANRAVITGRPGNLFERRNAWWAREDSNCRASL